LKETAKVVAFEPDLIFSSRIESTAQKAKYKVRIITDNEELLHQLATDPPDLLLLNLDSLEGNLESLERFVRKGTYKTIGYYSHMNAQLAEEAERIGVNTVSRRAFVARLNDLLR
jgi:DNA-binding NtrC family response regulator